MIGNQMNLMNVSKRLCVVYLFGTLFCLIVMPLPQVMAEETVKPSAMQKFTSGINPMNWRMPEFRSASHYQDGKVHADRKQDSFFDEFTASASRGWTKTKVFFNPSRFSPSKMFSSSDRSSSKYSSANRSKQDEPGFWSSWFSPKPEPKPIDNVNDFLRQSKPRL